MIGKVRYFFGKPVNFFNSFGTLGIYFQTGAWERNNSNNMGLFWMSLRYIACYSTPQQLTDFLPGITTNGIYTGYSMGFGIEINNLVNIKVLYYQYLKKPEIDYYLPIYQFSFNYSIKNWFIKNKNAKWRLSNHLHLLLKFSLVNYFKEVFF